MTQFHKPSGEIEQQLAEAEVLRLELDEYGTPDFASSLAMESLKSFQSDMRQEIKASKLLESNYAVEVALEGDPVENHAISGKFFGSVLVYLQDCLNALAYASTQSKELRKDLIPNNRLILAATGPGSFQASFVLPNAPEEEERLLDVEDVPPSPLELLAMLLDSNIDIEESSEILSNNKVKVRYGRIIGLLAGDGGDLTIRTRFNPEGASITAKEARDRREWLGLLRSKVEEKQVTGVLTGGSTETGRFEIKADEGMFRGRTSEIAGRQVRSFRFGEEVLATMEVTTTTHEDSDFPPRTAYLLKNVVSAKSEEEKNLFTLIEAVK